MQERDILTRKKTFDTDFSLYIIFPFWRKYLESISHNHRRRRHRAGGGTCPPNFWQRGHRGHNRIYGAPVKKFKRLMKKPNIQQRKCSACHPLATDTLPLIIHKQLCWSHIHTVFYVGTDSSQTPQIQFVDILYGSLVKAILNQPLYFVVDWIQVWCLGDNWCRTRSFSNDSLYRGYCFLWNTAWK